MASNKDPKIDRVELYHELDEKGNKVLSNRVVRLKTVSQSWNGLEIAESENDYVMSEVNLKQRQAELEKEMEKNKAQLAALEKYAEAGKDKVENFVNGMPEKEYEERLAVEKEANERSARVEAERKIREEAQAKIEKLDIKEADKAEDAK